MEQMKVRDLMRPIGEFARLTSRTSLLDAVNALEKAQKDFETGKAPQRIILVEDDGGTIVGKLSPMDVVQGLEPNYNKIESMMSKPPRGLSYSMLESLKAQFRLWERPLAELCGKAYSVKIENFIRLPTPGHMVRVDDRMDKAVNLFIMGRHDSLFVTDGGQIVGLIRFSDVYKGIAETMKACPLTD